MAAVTIDDAIATAKVLSDKTNDPSLTDTAFWLPAANAAREQFWQEVVSVNRDYWLTFKDATITVAVPYVDFTATTDAASGGWTMRKLRRVEKDPTSTARVVIPRRDFQTADLQRWPRGYMLRGKLVYIDPVELAAGNYRVWYVPGPTVLALGATLPSEEIPYREFIELVMAIKALVVEESDVSALESRLAGLRANLVATVEDQDAGEPHHIQDTLAVEEEAARPWGLWWP